MDFTLTKLNLKFSFKDIITK